LAGQIDLAEQIELAGQIDGQVVYLGDGVTSYGDALRKEAQGPQGASGRKVTVADLSLLRSSAAMIAALGAARVANGRLDSVSSLQPLYVRPSEAELKAKRPANAAGLEALWSKEKKSSSASMQTMMKS
jgi:tRNA A37 threonylcarbamoyltransferase TsaD